MARDAGRKQSRWGGAGGLRPGALALIYAAVGVLWVLFSDHLLDLFVSDPRRRDSFQIAKGWAFVLATALVVYLLARRQAAGQRRLEEEVRATFESLSDAVVVVDASGCVVEANRAAMELLRVSDKTDLLMPVTDRAPCFTLALPDGTPVLAGGLPPLRALSGESVRGFEAVLHRSDGSEVALEISAAPVRDRPGGPVRLAVAVLRDVTEQSRFDEMREEFLAIAAHEFKTPLAVIKAYAQLLQRRSDNAPAPLQIINRQVDRLNRLVHQLLEISRLRLSGGTLRREPFDLDDLVSNVAARMQHLLEGHRLQVRTGAAVPVEADRERLEQVLVNLIDNAVKFSPEGGEIETAVARRGAEAVVSIRDHGLGIPPERQAHIFERFYRAHAGTRQDYGGIGIGLDISREIVARHGGRIWFESQPGRGSTFFFTLPIAEQIRNVH